mmetsp:Transcript_26376/g.51578  ORF Transcript_26376/g.51578 Transcript_26376/m.51578 type:complete len:174 (+) Transcript_26376:2-523(+)
MQPPAAPAAPAGPEIETLLDAARYGDTEAAEDLTYVGKDVNARDSEMRTPIHWACAGGHSEIAQILIDNGCDLTAVDSKGNTPLHYATGYSQPDLARILLDAGAPTDVKNKNGKTSKDVVTLNPNNPIAGLVGLTICSIKTKKRSIIFLLTTSQHICLDPLVVSIHTSQYIIR